MMRRRGTLARFAEKKEYFTNGLVNPKLFEFDSQTTKPELTVFHIGNLDNMEIEKIGVAAVKKLSSSCKLYGWGEISETIVLGEGLYIAYNNIPNRRADIFGWPEERSRRKYIQQFLANNALPIRFSPPKK